MTGLPYPGAFEDTRIRVDGNRQDRRWGAEELVRAGALPLEPEKVE